jgi:hypothetical protein
VQSGFPYGNLVGDQLANRAARNGWAGMVIAGAVRDTRALSAPGSSLHDTTHDTKRRGALLILRFVRENLVLLLLVGSPWGHNHALYTRAVAGSIPAAPTQLAVVSAVSLPRHAGVRDTSRDATLFRA